MPVTSTTPEFLQAPVDTALRLAGKTLEGVDRLSTLHLQLVKSLLAESALSFLGLGVPPPAPSWGGMLSDSREFLADAPILALAPGIAISMALLGINLLGDALRDHFDPRSRNI